MVLVILMLKRMVVASRDSGGDSSDNGAADDVENDGGDVDDETVLLAFVMMMMMFRTDAKTTEFKFITKVRLLLSAHFLSTYYRMEAERPPSMKAKTLITPVIIINTPSLKYWEKNKILLSKYSDLIFFLQKSVKEPIGTCHELFMKTTKVPPVCPRWVSGGGSKELELCFCSQYGFGIHKNEIKNLFIIFFLCKL